MPSIAEVRRRLQRDLAHRRVVAGRDMLAAARQAQRTARAHAPVDTGELRQSIQVERDGNMKVSVIADTPYAARQEARTGFMRRGALAGDALLRRRGYKKRGG